jgi:hypothetical protein
VIAVSLLIGVLLAVAVTRSITAPLRRPTVAEAGPKAI